MEANQLFYYTGSVFFIFLSLGALFIFSQVVVTLIKIRKTTKAIRHLVEETREGVKTRAMELLLSFLGR